MQNNHTGLRPVFITGTPRSGTTLIYRTLLKHPVFKPKDLCLEETRIFMQSNIAIKSNQKPASLYNYMLEDDTEYQEYLDSIKLEFFWQKLCRNLRLSRLFSNEDSYWRFLGNAKIVRKYFYYAKRARNCERIVEKTPRHRLYSKRISTTFPHSKIIVTLGHPVDVFSSYKKRKKVEPNSTWLDISASEFIKRYHNMFNHVSKLVNDANILLVKYENFVQNPEKEFMQICNHVGVTYKKELLVKDEARLKDYKVDPFLSKPITKKTKEWSDFLSPDQVEFIESNLKNEMAGFGYESKL